MRKMVLDHFDGVMYSYSPALDHYSGNIDWAWFSRLMHSMTSPIVNVLELRKVQAAELVVKREAGGSKKKQALILQNQIAQEEKTAKAEIGRLCKEARECKENSPLKVPISSATGRVALNLALIGYYFTTGDKPQALDIWLDLGYDRKTLVDLLNSDEDYVVTSDGFIFPELLQEAYNIHLPKLKAFLKWMSALGDINTFQLEEMGDRLVPLNFNFFQKRKPRLDEWQNRAIDYLDKRESVLICAPTSSGKTIISTYMLQSNPEGGTIVMVVPSSALAMQVGGMFYSEMPWIVCDQLEAVRPEWGRPRVVIGTPDHLETLFITGLGELYRHGRIKEINVTGLVLDEIHNLNKYASMERLIHYFPKATLLGLSATVGNAEHLHKWMQSLRPGQNVHLEQVTQRFFNHQQHYYNANTNELHALSPLATITPDSLDSAVKGDVPFTPSETLRLYRAIASAVGEAASKHLSPSVYFAPILASSGMNRLSLGQAREYSKVLLSALCSLSAEVKATVLRRFHLDHVPEATNLPLLVTHLAMNKLPALAFNLNPEQCRAAFIDLLNYLETEDFKANPNRAKKLQKQARQYAKALRRWESTYNRLTSEQQRSEFERDNPPPESPEGEGTLDSRFIVGICRIGKEEIDNLWQSMRDAMGGGRVVAKFERVMRQFLTPFVEGIRRGIACYTKHMPVFYLRYVQQLAQQGMLGLVISDDSLAHGVNMPFRTVIFLGDHERLTPMMAQQMAGRSGRRGLDRAGHVIYSGISSARIKELMSGSLPSIVGTEILTPAVVALPVTFKDTVPREASLNSMLYKSLNSFAERDAAATEAHNAACLSRIGELQHSIESIALEDQILLFNLRNHPEALCIASVVLPATLQAADIAASEERPLQRGFDEPFLNLFAVIARYLESIPGSEPWTDPELPWAKTLLANIQAGLATHPGIQVPPIADRQIYNIFVQNQATLDAQLPGGALVEAPSRTNTALTSFSSFLDFESADSELVGEAAAPDVAAQNTAVPTNTPDPTTSAAPKKIAVDDGSEKKVKEERDDGRTPEPSGTTKAGVAMMKDSDGEDGVQDELEEMDKLDHGLPIGDEGQSNAVAPLSSSNATSKVDFVNLNMLKERLWSVSTMLLEMRNECARRSNLVAKPLRWRETMVPVNGVERAEVLLRGTWRRLFWILLEAPF